MESDPVSAEFRGKGYARGLIVTLMREVFDAGRIPFLHVKNENGAKFLYEKIGFKTRREVQFTVIAAKLRSESSMTV